MTLNGTNLGKVLGIWFALALSLGLITPSSAAPVLDGAGLTHALPEGVIDVRWGHHWRHHRHWHHWRHRRWHHRWHWRHWHHHRHW